MCKLHDFDGLTNCQIAIYNILTGRKICQNTTCIFHGFLGNL